MTSILFESAYRSGLERKIAAQLKQHGVEMQYEKVRINYVVPQRTTHYRPDFVSEEHKIIIEGKGRFGHPDVTAKQPLGRLQHPHADHMLDRGPVQHASKRPHERAFRHLFRPASDHPV